MSVSVVLCTYNGARFLTEQVESILQQTFPIAELIISDDASVDETVEIARKLAARDERIRLITLPKNMGITANFEQAVLAARYELIAVADQDDVWHPEKMYRMIEALEEDAVMIYCDAVKFSGIIPDNPRPSAFNRRMQGSDPRSIGIFNTVSGHSILFRRRLLAKAFPLPPGVYPDWWLAVVAMADSRLQFIPDILVYHRAHENNMTLKRGLSEAEHRKHFRNTLVRHLDAFRKIDDLTNEEQQFFQEGYAYWQLSKRQRWNPGLFRWLMRHRSLVFAYKIRKWPIISAFKNSWLLSFRWSE
jgi:glycosyltransferase involved in cell wall biosynthesis